ncbi:MAG TPA: S49 family peptidase, partial [Puia sp.]|nr:S49 family peptidase [Puia sp.]
VTFDGVKTAPEADPLTITRPLTPFQRQRLQNDVDSTYLDFKTRVADGRHRTIEYVDSIGQGRVWSGTRALGIGLVDRIGTLQDAIDCAARMAGTHDYSLREYPEPKNLLDQLLGGYKHSLSAKAMKEQLGEDGYKTWSIIKKAKSMVGVSQAKLPFDLTIE